MQREAVADILAVPLIITVPKEYVMPQSWLSSGESEILRPGADKKR